MIRRPPRSTQSRSSAASDVYKRQLLAPSCGFNGLDSQTCVDWHRKTNRPPKGRWTRGGLRRELVHAAIDVKAEMTGTEVADRVVHDAPICRVQLCGELEKGISDTQVQPVCQLGIRRFCAQFRVGVLERWIAASQQEVQHRTVKGVPQLLRVKDVGRDHVDEEGNWTLA